VVQFDRIPWTRRYIIKAIKFAISHPKTALLCLIIGIGPYMTLNEYNIAKKFIPKNPVEERMISYSDTWQHMPTLHLLCLLIKPKTILELGCRTGNTALPMLYAAHQYGGHVYSVDIETWPEIQNFKVDNRPLTDSWTFIESDDLKLEWDTPINFLYIDTSHTYEQTMKELEKYEPFLQSGGILALHDIWDSELSKAISDYFKNRKDVQYVRYFNNCGLGVILKN
jgi:predicted O-methyltransferase YrrM